MKKARLRQLQIIGAFSGKTACFVEIDEDATLTLEELKRRIFELEGTPTQLQKLFANGTCLDNDNILVGLTEMPSPCISMVCVIPERVDEGLLENLFHGIVEIDRLPAELRRERSVILNAAVHCPSAFRYASQELLSDRNAILFVLQHAHQQRNGVLAHVSDNLRSDRGVVFAALRRQGRDLEHVAHEFRNDRVLVLQAVRQNGTALEYASAELKGDKEVVLTAVRQDGIALVHASLSLQVNPEFILTAVGQIDHKYDVQNGLDDIKRSGQLLRNSPSELRSHGPIVKEIVSWNGLELEHASTELKCDSRVALVAIRQNLASFAYVGDNLKQQRYFALMAVNQTWQALTYFADDIRHDKQIVRAALQQNWNAIDLIGANLRQDCDLLTEELKRDRSFMLRAIRQRGQALQHAADELRKDRHFTLAAVRVNGFAFAYAATEFRSDYYVFAVASKQCGGALAHDCLQATATCLVVGAFVCCVSVGTPVGRASIMMLFAKIL